MQLVAPSTKYFPSFKQSMLRTFGGHIGYGVRPSARGQGLAAQALGEVLSMARDRGIREVLLTCDAKNTASRRTIERNGGRYESDVEYEGDTLQRFWITTDHD